MYACEGVAEVADVAAETFAKNRGNIRLFRGRSTEMEVGKDIPCRVPRVISELLGTGQSVGRLYIFSSHPPLACLLLLVGLQQRSMYEVLQQVWDAFRGMWSVCLGAIRSMQESRIIDG